MKTINLKHYYSHYQQDYFIEVPDEVANLLQQSLREESAFLRKQYRHKAYFSLDRADGIEHDMTFVSMTPEEIYERKVTHQQLYAAISALPDKQAKRLYAFYFLGMSKAQIARTEGISREAVSQSIDRGMKKVGEYLKKHL